TCSEDSSGGQPCSLLRRGLWPKKGSGKTRRSRPSSSTGVCGSQANSGRQNHNPVFGTESHELRRRLLRHGYAPPYCPHALSAAKERQNVRRLFPRRFRFQLLGFTASGIESRL